METILVLWTSDDGRKQLRTMALSPSDLKALQEAGRAEGRCSSLQTSDGLPCRRYPKPGYTVCRKHGERAPQTVAKANRALAAARLPAIEWYMDALDQASLDTCHECGFPTHSLKERKRIDTLARVIFDRTGLGPQSKLSVVDDRDSDSDLQVDMLTDDEKLTLSRLVLQVKELKDKVRSRLQRDAATLTLAAERVDPTPSE